MADNRYVDIDYVATGYDEVQNTAWYIESDYVAAGYVIQGITQSGEAATSAAFVVSAVSERTRDGSLLATATATFSATAVKVFGAESTQSVVSTLSATALQIVPDSLTAFSAITVTASAGKIFGAAIQTTSSANITVQPLRIRDEQISFSAFNTVVSAAGRIRPAVDITFFATTLTAQPTKIFGASTNTIDYWNTHQFPIQGVHLTENSYVDDTGYLLYRDSTSYFFSQSFSDSTVIAFYARATAQAEGVIFSFEGDGVNRPPWTFCFNPTGTNNSFRVGTPYGRTWTNLPEITDLHHYAIHFGGANGVTLYVDGIIQSNYSGTISAPNVGWYENYSIIYLGRSRTIENFGYPGGPNNYQVVQGTWYEGYLAQLWIGRPVDNAGLNSPQFVRITGYTPYTFESFGIYGNLSDSQVITVGTNTPNGAGTNSTLSQPNFYAEFSSSTPIGNLTDTNSLRISYPLQGNFTLTPTGYNIVNGAVAIISAFSISAILGKLQPSSMSCSSATALSATPYNFTKAQATLLAQCSTSADTYNFTKAQIGLLSTFTLSADVDEISSGASLVLATSTLTVSAAVIRRTSVTMQITTDCSGDATTNQLGRSQATIVATLSATPYNFTKGIVIASMVLTLDATARIFSPPRGTLLSGMQATLTATPLKLRIQTSTMTAQASVNILTGNALRSGTISMQAFDTVLSAGKIVEFLRENTITVTEEQRLLKIALESTVLLVEMANGVNSVMAENTDITVAQEQGVLLAQYNMPN